MMKTLQKIFTVICLFIGASYNSYGINYVSAGAGPADWNVASSWVPSGVPTKADNVTIAGGHTINSTANGYCNDLTVSGTLSWTVNSTVTVVGNYTITSTGKETSSVSYGAMQFNTSGKTLTVQAGGLSASNVGYTFYGNFTFAAGSVISKAATVGLQNGITLTNSGNLTVNGVATTTGSGWINTAGSTLTITASGFMNTRTFTSNASPNTVTLKYTSGSVPITTSGYYNLVIGATVSTTKTLAAATIVANNFTINSLNTFNVNGYDLSVGGNWVNNGTLTASAGKNITFNGSAAQTISGAGTTTFTGLAVNNTNGVSLASGAYILNEVLTISNGTFNTGGYSFIMASNSGQTARIAPITGSGAIAGAFTIQRFITTRDTTWSDLSSPVQNSTFGDWANELPYTYYGGTNPTQYTYDETADNFSPVTSAGVALTPGKGFEVYLTGSYTYANFPNTTINTIGVPNQGNQNLNALVSHNSAGTNLVGNPFASSISWDAVLTASSGLRSTIDMFDYTAGTYTTYGAGTVIGATQGFWVYAIGAPTLQIPESAKTNALNSSIRSSVVEPYFTLKLSSNDANNHYYHTLKIAANNNSSDGWDDNDHPFRKSPIHSAPSINTIIEGKKSVINSFSSSNDSYSMPVQTTAGIFGYYKIEAAGFDNVSEYSCIKLEDKVLNKTIDLISEKSYSFEMNAGDNADRFIVHFNKNGNCRAAIANNAVTSDFEKNITLLPTTEGNAIEFKFTESTPVNITVTNILGQTIVDAVSMNVQSQTENITIPSDFSGMYIVKIESSKGMIIKKYVRK